MSVPNQTPYIIYTANGLTTVFPFEFYIISASDIQVTINGAVVTTGYTVSGTGNTGGGDVTFLTPPASGVTVMLERVVPTFRLTDYQDNGDLLADTVNKDFDRLWMAIQRSFIFINRTLRVPEISGVNQLPAKEQRKNKLLAFNDAGEPITVLPQSGSASDVLIELAKPSGSGLIGAPDGRTVEQWLVESDSASYRAKNIAKLAWVDYQVHNRGDIGVCFLGDSITAGYDQTSSDVIPPQDGDWATRATMNYPYRFADYLKEKSGCNVSPFVMRAISGYTAKNAYEKSEWESNPNCDVVIINYGINDSGSAGTGIEDYMSYMEKLIRRYIDFGAAVIICAPYCGLNGAWSPTWLQWGRRMRMMATIYGCPCFDSFETNLHRYGGAVQSDQHHMNSMGYSIMGEKIASMMMAGGLLDSYKPLVNEYTVWPGMFCDSVGWCDAFGNISTGMVDGAYVRHKISGAMPEGQKSLVSFSFYLDAEAAHIYSKLNGVIATNYTNGTEWNNNAQPYYSHSSDQTMSYGMEIERSPKSAVDYRGAPGTNKFIGRVIGRGWHTISFSKGIDDPIAYIQSLTIQPIPVGLSTEQMWGQAEERRYKVVQCKKIPSPSGQNGSLPSAVALNNFYMKAPQSILGTGSNFYNLPVPNNYNSSHAKLIITNAAGMYIEALVVKTTNSGGMLNVRILNSTLDSGDTPGITCQFATSKRNIVYGAGAVDDNQPWVAIDDYNGGMQLQNINSSDMAWVGGVYLAFNLTWPGTAPTGYWNIELCGSDWFGNSESAFGAY
ncbi:GDSL-type esterase/lipase family protein [Citrobacter koseri]|uniref:GDSL-type esterase/lipase family protein n=1 Tax=Citrobacter koseri TaxID=545 RepID=UPI001FCB401C|nr:GDSL-type esterase/lipase family protein [Citrobacter koseri]MDM9068043.1 GDSL-type esterase/lipase family protein [Citrobacter koseri]MDM9082290.1 GDSL-type esterase/lipase family protein [Citrobacter koseri]MDM9090285.1 GDSL-type esterase/lipase family protein [Citrobacter koseri]MDM9096999.1 GDSL-type esterase/lipase family protein [Citrobacter koseri]MDM9270530.1 GDSL-type esterase/lipase family protein [Citrobacter koseri]